MDIWNRKVWLRYKAKGKGSGQTLLRGQGKVVRGFCLSCSQTEGTVPGESRRLGIEMRMECMYVNISYKVLMVMAFVQSLNEVLFR